MKPFPVIWKVNNDYFTKIDSGYVPATQYSRRNCPVIKLSNRMTNLPEVGSIVMLQVTIDTPRSYLSQERWVLRLYPIDNPHTDREYPELHFVSGATRTTSRGAFSKSEVWGDGAVVAEGKTLSGTGMHGAEMWFLLIKPGESYEVERKWRSNLGNSGERSEVVTWTGTSSLV